MPPAMETQETHKAETAREIFSIMGTSLV